MWRSRRSPGLPALALSYESEDVKAALKPVVEAVSNLHRLMLGMIGGIDPIHNRLRAVDREITVEFHHRVARIDQIRSVHLNFVVVLSMGEWCSKAQGDEEESDREMSATHRSTRVTTSHKEDYQLHDEFDVANR